MSGATFVRFYAGDWRCGTIGMGCEEEGFFIRVCAFIYDTGQRLPTTDDSRAAKLMRMHPNAYRKLLRRLVASGHIVERNGVWTVPRADDELEKATVQKREKDGSLGADTDRPAMPHTLVDTPLVSGGVSGGVFSEKPNVFYARLKNQEPVANREEKSPLPPNGGSDGQVRCATEAQGAHRARAPAAPPPAVERRSPVVPVADWSTAFASTGGVHSSVSLVDDRLVLVNGVRAFWLEQFGGDVRRLDLALIQARGEIQPRSRAHSLQAQVERCLARLAADRVDRDKRYAKAAASNASKIPTHRGVF